MNCQLWKNKSETFDIGKLFLDRTSPLTWAVISQERASLSGLKEKKFKNVPTSSSTLFGVLVEDYKNLHEFGEDLTGF